MTVKVFFIILFLHVANVNCWFSKREAHNDQEITGKSLGRGNRTEMYEYEGHEYIFHLEPRSWEDAIMTCQKEGGYLAVIEDPFELNFLSNAMEGRLCSSTVFQNVWIGARYFPEAKRWLWDATGYEVIEAGPGLHVEFPPWNLVHKPNYNCLNVQQDLNHQLKFTNLECHRKRRFLCERGCTKLYDTDRGVWSPDGCILDPAVTGNKCHLVCHSGMELDGVNPLTCTRFGWNNSIGVNVIPDCKGPDEITDDFLEELRQVLDDREGSLVVIIDETVEKVVFDLQITFVQRIIQYFLPSELRLVGLVGNGNFSRKIATRESLEGKSACQLHDLFDGIVQESSRKSDLSSALQTAHNLHQESISTSVAQIIILVSGNPDSVSDSRTIANSIKSSDGTILTIGVGQFDSDELISIASSTQEGPLYFSFSNVTNFQKMNQRLESNSTKNGSVCRKEAVAEFYKELNSSANASLLYVLDLSNSWNKKTVHQILELIEVITSAFPLSEFRHGGLILEDKYPKVEIALRIDSTCIFNRHIAKIEFSSNQSDHHLHEKLEVHRLAHLEIRRNNPNRKTITVVISEMNAQIFLKPWLETLEEVYFVEIKTKENWKEAREMNKIKSLKIANPEHMNDTIKYLQALADVNVEDCSAVCKPLEIVTRGKWKSENGSCVELGWLGQHCHLVCLDAYELVGSNPLICTEDGWSGTAGDDVIPKCMTPEEIAESFMEKINGVLANDVESNLLFVLDESGSVTLPNFQMEIDFVSAVVDAFPLSHGRRAGLTIFSDAVRVVIAATAHDTCRFIRASRRVRYRGGQTDIQKALMKARDEIKFRAVHPQTLVFLITDGISQTDPSGIAELLRSEGVVLFIIAVADYEQEQLEPLASIGPDGTTNFFGVKSFRVFHVIAEYLNSTFRGTGVNNCTSGQRQL